jgi:hypothetical protein
MGVGNACRAFVRLGKTDKIKEQPQTEKWKKQR